MCGGSTNELADMHFLYSLATVARLCLERYPGRSCPERKIFVSIHRHLCEHGNAAPRLPIGDDSWSRWRYFGCCEWHSWNQHRKAIIMQVGVAHSTVWRVARTTAVTLPSAACTGRVTTRLPCANNVLPASSTTCGTSPNFLAFVIFMVEEHFTTDGI
jgi:hypothetical protein